jgi:hypothetical protein
LDDDARPRAARRRARHGDTTDDPGGDEGRRPGGRAEMGETVSLATVGLAQDMAMSGAMAGAIPG